LSLPRPESSGSRAPRTRHAHGCGSAPEFHRLPPDRGITYPATVAGGRDAAEAGSRRDRERARPHAPEPRSTGAAEYGDGGRGRGGETRKRGGEEGRGEDEYVLAPRMSVLRVPGSAPGPRRERA